MTPHAVIFDVGNVLIEWHPEPFYDRVLGAERRKTLFAEVDLYGMNAQLDLGAPFKDSVYALADAHPDWADAIRLWHDRWIEMASPAIDHSARLFWALKARQVPVFSLTNFGIGPYETAAQHYPFLSAFDRDHISGHLQMMKPDPRIYQHLEASCGLDPATLLFADDRPENIAAAAERGWQTHLFEHPQGWAQCLIDKGLLTPEEAV